MSTTRHSDKFKDLGILNKYRVSRADGTPVDEGAEYFVLRLDAGGKDRRHVAACRAAVVEYANRVADHLPALSAELLDKYGPPGPRNSARAYYSRRGKVRAVCFTKLSDHPSIVEIEDQRGNVTYAVKSDYDSQVVSIKIGDYLVWPAGAESDPSVMSAFEFAMTYEGVGDGESEESRVR
jgi:hypothetical protein